MRQNSAFKMQKERLSKLTIKILGFVGSVRRNKNTHLVVESCLKGAREGDENVETKLVYVSDLHIGPCRACYDACSNSPYECAVKDGLQGVLNEMVMSDALVFGSPRYFPMPSSMVAFMERLVCLSYSTEMKHPRARHPLEDKPCGLIAVSGGSDVIQILQQLENFALCLKMQVVTLKNYPYVGIGGTGNVAKDEDLKPLENAKILGRKLVETIRRKGRE
jgi:multimeric flavodoxin WrbA